MEQSPSEADSHSASRRIPRLVWNPKDHYRVQKSQQLVPALRQMNPVHILPPYYLQIHSNIMFLSTPRPSVWSLPFRFSDQNLYAFLIMPMRATYPARIIFGEMYKL